MIEVFVVRNEQLPYTEGELGFPTAAMPTKKDSGVRQTGDYYVEIGGVVMPTVFERKSLQDAYGSFIIEKNRARLYAEIDRFQADDRFDKFVIVIEATRKMFDAYFPWAVLKWHKKRGDVQRVCGASNKKKGTVLQHL